MPLIDPYIGAETGLRLYCRYQLLCAQDIDESLHIVGQHMQAHLRATCFNVFIWKCVAPIQYLMVPNGCSTVDRLTFIMSGACSSRASTVSSIASCSQRLMRLSLPVVHFDFIEQLTQAEDQ